MVKNKLVIRKLDVDVVVRKGVKICIFWKPMTETVGRMMKTNWRMPGEINISLAEK